MSLIIAYKNFFRTKMMNLSVKSVKHFVPDAKFYSVNLFKNSSLDYENEPKIDMDDYAFHKTKFVNKNNSVQDHVDTTQTSGYGNPDNAAYFAEGFNLIYEHFKDYNGKVLMLTEDHFFTNGETLKEILEIDSPCMFGQGDGNILAANGSILCINPSDPDVKACFPLPEVTQYAVESLLLSFLVKPLFLKGKAHPLSTRKWIDYCGDGIYTNSSVDMETEMKKAGIL